MKLISIKAHGFLDYFVGLIFLLIPSAMGWEAVTMPAKIFYIMGALTISYSLFTKYRFGMLAIIPFKVHLIIDAVSGIFLALSPWLFNFYGQAFIPHLFFGLFEILVVILTRQTADPIETDVQH